MPGPVARALMPRKRRLQELSDGLLRLEADRLRTQPIQAIRYRTCEHPECGPQKPSELPQDALLLELGCQYEIPPAVAPEGTETASRVERAAERGVNQGLGPEGVRQAIASIRLLNR